MKRIFEIMYNAALLMLFIWVEAGLLSLMNTRNDLAFMGGLLGFTLVILLYCKAMYELYFKRKPQTNDKR